jgi:hypothetical protein
MEEAPNGQVGEVLSSTLNIILLLPDIRRLCGVTCRAYRLDWSLGLENKETFRQTGEQRRIKVGPGWLACRVVIQERAARALRLKIGLPKSSQIRKEAEALGVTHN